MIENGLGKRAGSAHWQGRIYIPSSYNIHTSQEGAITSVVLAGGVIGLEALSTLFLCNKGTIQCKAINGGTRNKVGVVAGPGRVWTAVMTQ